ncbi:MAG: hypothetical protein HKL96_02485 [Phycisphaerales bacterium]|nr:hypothetical protein [Phycisphaerales bacterium]
MFTRHIKVLCWPTLLSLLMLAGCSTAASHNSAAVRSDRQQLWSLATQAADHTLTATEAIAATDTLCGHYVTFARLQSMAGDEGHMGASSAKQAWHSCLLAVVADAAGRHIMALGLLYKSVGLMPREPAFNDLLLRELLTAGQYRHAVALARQAIKSGQFGDEAWRWLALAYATQDRTVKALSVVSQGLGHYSKSRALLTLQIAIEQSRHDVAAQKRSVMQFIRQFPKDRKGYLDMIDLAEQASAPAVANYFRASYLRRFPKDDLSRIFKIETQTFPPILSIMRSKMQALQRRRPQSKLVLVGLCQIEGRLHNISAQARLLNAYLLRYGDQLDVARQYMQTLLAEHKSALAAKTLMQWSLRHPEWVSWQLFCAQSLIELKQIQQGDSVLKALVGRCPHSSAAIEALAYRLQIEKHPAAAVQLMQRFMNQYGTTVPRLLVLTDLYFQAHQTKKAVQTQLRVLSIMPANAEVNNDLGYTWADQGVHLARAKAMILRAIRNYPFDAASRDSLGWVLYKQGHPHHSLVELLKAIELPGGQNPDGLNHFAIVLNHIGNTPHALVVWGLALRLLAQKQHLGALAGHDLRLRSAIKREMKTARLFEKIRQHQQERSM